MSPDTPPRDDSPLRAAALDRALERAQQREQLWRANQSLIARLEALIGPREQWK